MALSSRGVRSRAMALAAPGGQMASAGREYGSVVHRRSGCDCRLLMVLVVEEGYLSRPDILCPVRRGPSLYEPGEMTRTKCSAESMIVTRGKSGR